MREDSTLARERFTGHITMGKERFPTAFDVWSGEDCRLMIDIQPLATNDVFVLQQAMGKPGSYSTQLSLEGSTENGSTFLSDSIEIHAASFGTHGNAIKVTARKAKVTVALAEAAGLPMVRLWFRGFKTYHAPPVSTALGQVRVVGTHKPANEDEASAYVSVTADDAIAPETWFVQADRLLTFMHLGLGFCHGGRLQTPRLDVVVDDRWEATYFDGHGFSRNLAPIHHLNQGPFIKALAERFDNEAPFPHMLWTAIGWLHDISPVDEARFLMSMTALETVVEHVIPEVLTTVIPKQDFDLVRATLLEGLASHSMDPTAMSIFQGKLKGLNGRVLFHKILALRDHYGLPPTVFSDEAMAGIIKARNDIVHKGGSAESTELWPKEVFIRELIALIVFRELDYKGPYESYIGGYRTVHGGIPDGTPAAPRTTRNEGGNTA